MPLEPAAAGSRVVSLVQCLGIGCLFLGHGVAGSLGSSGSLGYGVAGSLAEAPRSAVAAG